MLLALFGISSGSTTRIEQWCVERARRGGSLIRLAVLSIIFAPGIVLAVPVTQLADIVAIDFASQATATTTLANGATQYNFATQINIHGVELSAKNKLAELMAQQCANIVTTDDALALLGGNAGGVNASTGDVAVGCATLPVTKNLTNLTDTTGTLTSSKLKIGPWGGQYLALDVTYHFNATGIDKARIAIGDNAALMPATSIATANFAVVDARQNPTPSTTNCPAPIDATANNTTTLPPVDSTGNASTAYTAVISAIPQQGYAPLTVKFSAQTELESTCVVSPCPSLPRTWNFGDGGSSTALAPSHAYTLPGMYDVSVNIKAANGAEANARTAVVVLPQPEVAQIPIRFPVSNSPEEDIIYAGTTGMPGNAGDSAEVYLGRPGSVLQQYSALALRDSAGWVVHDAESNTLMVLDWDENAPLLINGVTTTAAEIVQSVSELANLQQQLDALLAGLAQGDACGALGEQITQLQAQLQEKDAQISGLTASNASANAQISELTTQINTLQALLTDQTLNCSSPLINATVQARDLAILQGIATEEAINETNLQARNLLFAYTGACDGQIVFYNTSSASSSTMPFNSGLWAIILAEARYIAGFDTKPTPATVSSSLNCGGATLQIEGFGGATTGNRTTEIRFTRSDSSIAMRLLVFADEKLAVRLTEIQTIQ